MDSSYLNTEALNCRCCGGVLKVKSSLCECDYCGATNFISDVASKYTNQLNRANKLRQEREFDNAARIYDVILEENAPTADILWLRTLCEYGIEYVPDPVSDKYFPTLHRINEESILTYPSYIEALSLADGDEKESLIKEAEYINSIQNEYLHIAENESPYDVFICYKETDEETGEQTEDVGLAETLYNDLSNRGFKVFFAKETLKEKLSIDYEPYIFAALKSARAMVVLGTKAEYFMSVWVKNEWGRFLRLMQKDSDKQIFFACDDPEELPRAFATRQAQLLGREGALNNLANNVEDYLRRKSKTAYEYDRERLLENSKEQDDFSAIVRKKAKDYVEKFEESESAQRKNEIIDNLIGSEEVFLYFFKRAGWSAAIGYLLIIIGAYVFVFANMAVSDLQHTYTFLYDDPKPLLTLRILVSAPFILAGAVILLSYNAVLDIITTFVTGVFIMIPAITHECCILYIFALALPPVIYLFNNNAVFTITNKRINRYRDHMYEAAIAMRKDFEDLKKTVIIDPAAEINKSAEKLLEQYKEEKKISSPVEIKEEDYNVELKKLGEIYENAKICYAKYIEVLFPTEENERVQKKDSLLSILALFLSCIPLVGTVVALIDLLHDKYDYYSHRMTYAGILAQAVMIFALVYMANLMY